MELIKNETRRGQETAAEQELILLSIHAKSAQIMHQPLSNLFLIGKQFLAF